MIVNVGVYQRVVAEKEKKMDKVNEAYWKGYHNGYACAMEDNAKLTIVRCKDCKHLSVRSGALGVYKCAIHNDYPSGEYFCADGERREDETN